MKRRIVRGRCHSTNSSRRFPARVGVIGYGAIGGAMARRFYAVTGEPIAVTSRGSRKNAQEGVTFAVGNAQLVRACEVIFIAVKPVNVRAVLEQIAPHLDATKTLVSVAASIDSQQLRAWAGVPVIRAMPSMPARYGEGMTALARNDAVPGARFELVLALLRHLGRVVVIEEALMDAATAIGGCGPAYAYVMIEAFTDAGVKLGLPRAVALELAAQSFLGAGRTVLESGAHPAALKDEVTTPAGCTVDGLLALEEGNIRATIARAAVAAAARSRELRSGP